MVLRLRQGIRGRSQRGGGRVRSGVPLTLSILPPPPPARGESQPREPPPNLSSSHFLLSVTATPNREGQDLMPGLPSLYHSLRYLAKFPCPSPHLPQAKSTKPEPHLPKRSTSTSVGLWLGSWPSERDSGGGMVGAWGSAGSCWGPGDRAGAASCCMESSAVSILGFDVEGRERRAPDV